MNEKELQPVTNQDDLNNQNNNVDNGVNSAAKTSNVNAEESTTNSDTSDNTSEKVNDIKIEEKTSDIKKDETNVKVKQSEETEAKKETEAKEESKADVKEAEVKEAKEESKAEVKEAEVKEADVKEADVKEAKQEDTKTEVKERVSEEDYDIESENEGIDEEDEEDQEDEEDAKESKEDFSSMTREELINRLHDLLQTDDIIAIKPKVAGIKVAFHEKTKAVYDKRMKISGGLNIGDEEGEVEDNYVDPLEQRFVEVFNIYKQKRKDFLDNLEQEKRENLEKKKEILEKIRILIESEESLKTTYDKFNELQDQWKEIGQVPKSELNNLWQNYHFLVEKFFDKVKISRELRDLDYQKNMEAKIALCERAEELLLEKSIIKSFKKLQEYHQAWREIGPVPSDKRDELWDRFKTATDKINARRKEHYFQLKDQQDSNFAAKTALIEEAKALTEELPTNVREWHSKSDQLQELFRIWKTIGPASRKQNEEIWQQFKSVMDRFYTGRKEFFAKLKEEQYNNYNLKLDLCTKAEAVKDSTDWRETTSLLINLQKEWKEIGPVPRKMSDKIWKRFRGACDEFFNRKKEYFSNINERYDENKQKKEEIISKIKNLEIGENLQEALDELKALQREWMSVGYVAFKDKNDVNSRYKKALDEKFNLLRDKGVEVYKEDFKNKINVLKENPNANQLISQEKRQLLGKLQSMKDDVTLWENNIGFLSNSKNSMLLKTEFEKKIKKAKQEIALLEAKIRYLDGQ